MTEKNGAPKTNGNLPKLSSEKSPPTTDLIGDGEEIQVYVKSLNSNEINNFDLALAVANYLTVLNPTIDMGKQIKGLAAIKTTKKDGEKLLCLEIESIEKFMATYGQDKLFENASPSMGRCNQQQDPVTGKTLGNFNRPGMLQGFSRGENAWRVDEDTNQEKTKKLHINIEANGKKYVIALPKDIGLEVITEPSKNFAHLSQQLEQYYLQNLRQHSQQLTFDKTDPHDTKALANNIFLIYKHNVECFLAIYNIMETLSDTLNKISPYYQKTGQDLVNDTYSLIDDVFKSILDPANQSTPQLNIESLRNNLHIKDFYQKMNLDYRDDKIKLAKHHAVITELLESNNSLTTFNKEHFTQILRNFQLLIQKPKSKSFESEDFKDFKQQLVNVMKQIKEISTKFSKITLTSEPQASMHCEIIDIFRILENICSNSTAQPDRAAPYLPSKSKATEQEKENNLQATATTEYEAVKCKKELLGTQI